ncbi:MAG: general secretion pathway protein GspL [Burkholderiales bacterium]|nr:general secretion pathway protein GspL [Burkholderiales bacterium]
MSTLYIRLPSRAVADSPAPDATFDCQFAVAADDSGAVEREGAVALSLLGDAITKAQRVVIILAAGDVTLLQVKVPPMSAARLKAALPNLVEEQLISDPADCLLTTAPATAEGMRTIAVVNRAWLEKIVHKLIALGARNIVAVPAQLCLPYQPDTVSAAVGEYSMSLDMELALRSGEYEGMGLSMLPEQPDSGAPEAVQSLCTLAPTAAIALYVPQERVIVYQSVLHEHELEERVSLFADNWPRWIAGAKNVPINVAAGLGAAAGPSLHWQPWRWPLILAGLLLLVNIIGLNVDWLRLKREATGARAMMMQIYKSVYPNETAILDPVAQMKQKIKAAQHRAGQASPSDFLVLATQFGEAWQSVLQGSKGPGIVSLDYAEGGLQVKLKSDVPPPTAQMQTALAARNLSLVAKAPDLWQIRSAK